MKYLIAGLLALMLATTTAEAAGKPPGCPSPWCGCWLWHHLGIQPDTAKKLGLNRASNWRKGPTTAHVGAIGFRWRGGNGGGHVGIVTEVRQDGVMLLSGNHNNAVATSFYPMRGMSFYQNPTYQFGGAFENSYADGRRGG